MNFETDSISWSTPQSPRLYPSPRRGRTPCPRSTRSALSSTEYSLFTRGGLRGNSRSCTTVRCGPNMPICNHVTRSLTPNRQKNSACADLHPSSRSRITEMGDHLALIVLHGQGASSGAVLDAFAIDVHLALALRWSSSGSASSALSTSLPWSQQGGRGVARHRARSRVASIGRDMAVSRKKGRESVNHLRSPCQPQGPSWRPPCPSPARAVASGALKREGTNPPCAPVPGNTPPSLPTSSAPSPGNAMRRARSTAFQRQDAPSSSATTWTPLVAISGRRTLPHARTAFGAIGSFSP